MSNRSKNNKKRDQYKPFKIAAIPVLLGVLGWLVFSGGDAKTANPTLAATGESAGSSAVPEFAQSTATVPASIQWQADDLAFLEGPNPLAGYRQPEIIVEQLVSVEQADATIESTKKSVQEELERQPLRYHFESGGRSVVMLGDRLMKTGDTLVEDVTLREVKYGNLVLAIDKQPETKDEVQ